MAKLKTKPKTLQGRLAQNCHRSQLKGIKGPYVTPRHAKHRCVPAPYADSSDTAPSNSPGSWLLSPGLATSSVSAAAVFSQSLNSKSRSRLDTTWTPMTSSPSSAASKTTRARQGTDKGRRPHVHAPKQAKAVSQSDGLGDEAPTPAVSAPLRTVASRRVEYRITSIHFLLDGVKVNRKQAVPTLELPDPSLPPNHISGLQHIDCSVSHSDGFELDPSWSLAEAEDFLRERFPQLFDYLDSTKGGRKGHTWVVCCKFGRKSENIMVSSNPSGPTVQQMLDTCSSTKRNLQERHLILSTVRKVPMLVRAGWVKEVNLILDSSDAGEESEGEDSAESEDEMRHDGASQLGQSTPRYELRSQSASSLGLSSGYHTPAINLDESSDEDENFFEEWTPAAIPAESATAAPPSGEDIVDSDAMEEENPWLIAD